METDDKRTLKVRDSRIRTAHCTRNLFKREICAICHELCPGKGHPETCFRLPCGHGFHLACINSCFNNQKWFHCPLCRQEVIPDVSLSYNDFNSRDHFSSSMYIVASPTSVIDRLNGREDSFLSMYEFLERIALQNHEQTLSHPDLAVDSDDALSYIDYPDEEESDYDEFDCIL